MIGLPWKVAMSPRMEEYLDLLVDRKRMVEFAIEIEPRGQGAGGCSDAGEVGVAYVILLCEVCQAAENFVAFAEDDGVGALSLCSLTSFTCI